MENRPQAGKDGWQYHVTLDEPPNISGAVDLVLKGGKVVYYISSMFLDWGYCGKSTIKLWRRSHEKVISF